MSGLSLRVNREQAEELLTGAIQRGESLKARVVQSQPDLDELTNAFEGWKSWCCEVLHKIFEGDDAVSEFIYVSPSTSNRNWTPNQWGDYQRKEIDKRTAKLESFRTRLELLDEPSASTVRDQNSHLASRKVFIVHGHDTPSKLSVENLIRKLDLEPIILADQPGAGKTIIEKLEQYSEVAFVVVLLTGDDMGAPGVTPDHLKPRARQNVILELGYFIGRLGRDLVCPLYEAGVELPSDYRGVGYILLDEHVNWRQILAKEMQNAGLDVNLNKL